MQIWGIANCWLSGNELQFPALVLFEPNLAATIAGTITKPISAKAINRSCMYLLLARLA
jgi:hypothetical protein